MSERINARLSQPLAEFVDRMVGKAGLYETPSEYVRDLIRRDMERRDGQCVHDAAPHPRSTRRGGLRAAPTGAIPPASTDLAASDRQQFLLVRLRATTAGPGCHPLLDEVAKPLPGLLFLIAPNQVAGGLSGVAVTACCDPVIDVPTRRLGQCETHGLATHDEILDGLTLVVNPLPTDLASPVSGSGGVEAGPYPRTICSNAASIARVCATTSQPGSARNRPRSARFNCRSARRSAAMQRAMRT